MRLPGTRYQEHGWEQVRKLLGHCSLQAFARLGHARLLSEGEAALSALSAYVDLSAEALRAVARTPRATAPGNSYGETALELAVSLVFELGARPADWLALCTAVAGEHARLGAFWEQAGGEAILRKKVNDLYAVLRDKVDADNYQVACGRACSPNRMYAYRMLDTSYAAIAAAFADWERDPALVGAILGREVVAMPIEVRQMKSIAACKAEWILAWSAAQERFAGAPGPLHTRSKRFASLKNSPDKIAAMLAEIGDYAELSENRDRDWLFDADQAGAWLADLWRVVHEADNPGPDCIEAAPDSDGETAPPDDPHPPGSGASSGSDVESDAESEADADAGPDAEADAEAESNSEADPAMAARATAVSLPPRFLTLAGAAQDRASWSARMLIEDSLPVRLAVYLKMLGADDDCYPDQWRDPATGELPTMQQLAVLDGVSLPTLRKRRDAAIARLQGAAGLPKGE